MTPVWRADSPDRAPAGLLRAAAVTAPFLLVAALNLVGVTFSERWRHGYDLHIYLGSARAWLATGTPYTFVTPRGLGFTYPPVALLPVLPWTLLGETAARLCWVLLIAALGAALCGHWFRRLAPDAPYAVLVAAAAIVAATEPVNDSMYLGQLSPFIGAAAFVAVAGVASRSGGWAGVGAALKITPLADLAAIWLLPDRWRRAALALGVAGALTALGFVLAPAASAFYWTSALWDTRRVGRTGTGSNTSLPGWFAHLGLTDGPALVAGVLLTGLLGLGWWWHGRRSGSTPGQVDLAVAVGCLTLLASPVSWSHHGLAVCLGWAFLALQGRWAPAVIGGVVWTLPLFRWAGELHGPAQVLLQSVRPLSVVWLLWLTLPGRRAVAGPGGTTTDRRQVAARAQASG